MGCCGSKKKEVVEEEEPESSEEKLAKYARAPRYSKYKKGKGKMDSDELNINDKPGKEEAEKVYSWDKPRNIDISRYMMKDLNNKLAIRSGGQINGQQFIVQNSEDSVIVLLDYSDTITIDNCTGCRFIIGPVGGSIFFRNCYGCSCSVACQQFRTRDCDEMNIFLHCTTQPVIESSRNMHFRPMRMFYLDLMAHYKKAKLSLFDNHWDNIHDFTPDDYHRNYSTSTPKLDPVEIFKFDANAMEVADDGYGLGQEDPAAIQYAKNRQDRQDRRDKVYKERVRGIAGMVELSFTDEDCLIPLWMGEPEEPGEIAVVILFHHERMSEEIMLDILHTISGKLSLVMTRHFDVGSDEALRMFIDDSPQSEAFREAATTGRMVGAEYSGEDAVAILNSTMEEYMSGLPGAEDQTICYTSPNDEDTNHVLNVLNTLHNSRFDS